MSLFKYFAFPDKYSRILPENTLCALCQKKKKCFDGALFKGIESYAAFCMDCLSVGGLREINVNAVEGDMGELQRQLTAIHPESSGEDIRDAALCKTKELESCTPPLITWQSWYWPCHCGDYCRFLQIAGQEDFNRLAPAGNGKKLFQTSLNYDLREFTDVDSVWKGLKPGSISGNSAKEDNWNTLAYIFTCLNCSEYITIWDCS